MEFSNAAELRDKLLSLGVTIYAENGRLRVSAPSGTLSEDLQRALSARKAELLELFDELPLRSGLGNLQGGHVSLSWGQRSLWLISQMDDHSAAYNIPLALRLRGPLDVAALRDAFAEVVMRHAPLRTVVGTVDNIPVGRVLAAPSSELFFGHEDFSHLANDVRERELSARFVSEAGKTFDLGSEILVRGRLVAVGTDDHVLIIVIHHIAADGFSLAVFMRDLSAAYTAIKSGTPIDFPTLSIQYADYAAWQQRSLERGGKLADQVKYWRNHLAGAVDLLTLPTDRARNPSRSRKAGYLPLHIEPGLAKQLETLAQQHRVTVFVVVLAAFAATLGRLAGQNEVVIGTPIAGRSRVETENLVGLFVNTLPLRLDLSGDPDVAALIARARDVSFDALDNQDIPFEQVVQGLSIRRSRAHTPVFQVMLAWQNQEPPSLDIPGLTSEHKFIESPQAKFDLTLHFENEPDGGHAGIIEYDASLFDHETVSRWSVYLARMIEGMAATVVPNSGAQREPLSARRILDRAEQDLPLESNKQAGGPPLQSTLNALFGTRKVASNKAIPLTETERRLVEIWKGILKVDVVGRTDDFFELGGHSLLAVQMLNAVETEFGRRINLASMFEAPTIESLASAIESDDEPQFDFRKVVRLYPGSDRPQLFGINNTGAYYQLAKQLGPEWPLTALQLFDPTYPVDRMPESIDQIAAQYVQLIRRLQPKGPYNLLSWCAGSILTVEVAHQLLAANEEVSFLAIIEGYAPFHYKRFNWLRYQLAANSFRIKWNLAEFRKVRAGKLSLRKFLTNRRSLQAAASRFQSLRESGYEPPAAAYELWLMESYLNSTAKKHQLKPFPGRIHLFRASEMPKGMFLDELNWWGSYAARGVDVSVIEGDHHSVFRPPGVDQMADRISAALAVAMKSIKKPAVENM